jgi:3-methyladenine DNA glycosylase AlkD
MSTADVLLDRLQAAYEAAGDPVRAGAAAAYMRNQFPFLGIPATLQAAIFSEITRGLQPPSGDAELAAVTLACWELPEREYQHFATTYAQRYVKRANPGFVPTLERLVTTKSWWTRSDGLATHLAGPLVAAHPQLRGVMDRWVESENIWLARLAISTRSDTASGRTRKCCLRIASSVPMSASSSSARRSAGRSAPTPR